MEETDTLLLKSNTNVYKVDIKAIKINNVEAYYATYNENNSSKTQVFQDSNAVPYYFSSKEFLKEILIKKLT